MAAGAVQGWGGAGTGLRVETVRQGPRQLVSLTGRLSRAEVGSVRRVLRQAGRAAVEAVVCDLSGLTTAHPASLVASVSRIQPALAWPAPPVWLAGATGQVAVMLGQLPPGSGFGVAGSVEEAVRLSRLRPLWPRAARLLPAGRAAPRWARELAADACRAWRLPEVTDTLMVVVSELVTNAVVHARSDLEMRLECRAGGVWVAVRDHGPGYSLAGPRAAAPVAAPDVMALPEGGRGLVLVKALVNGAGVASHPAGGTITWACIELPTPAPVRVRDAHVRPSAVSARIPAHRGLTARRCRWSVDLRLDWSPHRAELVTMTLSSVPPHPSLPDGRWELPHRLLRRALHAPVRYGRVRLHSDEHGRSVYLTVDAGRRPWAVQVPSVRLRRFLDAIGDGVAAVP